ncbi:hypothetical protein AAFF_G00156700 [Aldrovandia affinis]|uniref:Uncharacterized protein n=1 Tax=Aldrovandia affinis TaxID=143900 RepID=A0AAD7W863_9TELE|nr:hypothetical protein AAFF_G00156700 [Aldrovandia affinis]
MLGTDDRHPHRQTAQPQNLARGQTAPTQTKGLNTDWAFQRCRIQAGWPQSCSRCHCFHAAGALVETALPRRRCAPLYSGRSGHVQEGAAERGQRPQEHSVCRSADTASPSRS